MFNLKFDLTGKIFGRLTVIEYVKKGKWLCKCNCNNIKIFESSKLRKGTTISCGCYSKEISSERMKRNNPKENKIWEPISIDVNTYGIPLTKGQIALIDRDDFDKIKDYGWWAGYDKIGKTFYVIGWVGNKNVSMHRFLMQATTKDEVDHRDHNTLNNRKDNLRICTRSQNSINRRHSINNHSGFKGVSFHKGTGMYQANININKKRVYLGLYPTAKEASIAYEQAAIKLHGEFKYNNVEV